MCLFLLSEKRTRIILMSAILLFLQFTQVSGQVPITASNLVYEQNFDAFLGTQASVGTHLPGWTVSVGNFVGRGCGSATNGGAYAFGSGTDYALGYLPSSTVNSFTARVTFINNTGSPITELDISYMYENWRWESRTNGFAVTSNVGNVSSLNHTAPSGSGNCNGNTGSVLKSVSLTGLNITNGSTFYIEWKSDRGDGSGSSRGIAIDDLTVVAKNAAVVCTVTDPGVVSSTAGNSFCGTPSSTTLSLAGTDPATGITYQWKSSADSINWINEGTNATLTTTPAATTFYKCIVTCSAGAAADSTPGYKITVNPLPAATISGGTTICSGEQAAVNFSGTANATVHYTANGQSRSIVLGSTGNAELTHNFTANTTYEIVEVDDGSCSQTITGQEAAVAVTALPVAAISNDTAICSGNAATITFTGTPGATVRYTAGTQQQDLLLDLSGAAGITRTFIFDTTYTIVDVTEGSCTNSTIVGEQAEVRVNPLPITTVSTSNATVICETDSVILTAHQDAGYSYEWNHNDTHVPGGDVLNVKETGSYKVIITDANNCTDSSVAIPVTVLPIPQISITQQDTAFCAGGVVTLHGITSDTGVDFRWQINKTDIPNASASFLEIDTTGVYSLVINRTNVTGCRDTSSDVSVTVYPVVIPEITWDGELFHAQNHYTGYQWYDADGLIDGEMDSVFVPSVNGAYYVSATDTNGCVSDSRVYNVTNVGIAQADVLYAPVRLYPNPVSGLLQIVSDHEVSITLFSLDGKILTTERRVRTLDMSSYADGVYLLRVTDKEGNAIKNERIVKRSY